MLRAPITISQGLVAPSSRDEFNQTAGALIGKTAAVGGNWAAGITSGATDLAVDATAHAVTRTTTSDAGYRADVLGSAMAAMTASVDIKTSTLAYTPTATTNGLVVRFVDSSNYGIVWADFTNRTLNVSKVIAGVGTPISATALAGVAASMFFTLAATVDAEGRFLVQWGLQGSQTSLAALIGQDSAFATGGTLASGKVGIIDYNGNSTSATRTYDNFSSWVPTSDAVIYSSRSLELNTLGITRQDTGGTAYGPVAQTAGDLPRMPNRSSAGTVEFFAKASRGDMQSTPDPGIDDVSCRIYRRASYLTVG